MKAPLNFIISFLIGARNEIELNYYCLSIKIMKEKQLLLSIVEGMSPSLKIFVCGTLIGALITSIPYRFTSVDPSWKTNNKNLVKQAEIERLKPGMSLFEVEAILGRGTKIEQSIDSITYKWENSDKTYLTCIFDSKNKLLKLHQNGLK